MRSVFVSRCNPVQLLFDEIDFLHNLIDIGV